LGRNCQEALKWYRKAAEQGNAEAQYQLGYKYAEDQRSCIGSLEGRDYVPRDDVEAIKWYRKAAEQGCASAYRNLASCYSTGRGVHKDIVRAYCWRRLAAEFAFTEDNDEDAINNLLTLMSLPERETAQRLCSELKAKHACKQ
jgi:TPR repeat protein